ncbi:hypothetical protein IEQ34_002414 [Dendrobium chrysotoxum]|uniref:Uncharacterized protein n=1 Tax=Dendrobium chrysotoxum TaxID=161865 RepID=A0AAV7HJT2_DENCH|nr:hypothetical protein IEQ34_002414 [Dendrobium chrysotoxum]
MFSACFRRKRKEVGFSASPCGEKEMLAVLYQFSFRQPPSIPSLRREIGEDTCPFWLDSTGSNQRRGDWGRESTLEMSSSLQSTRPDQIDGQGLRGTESTPGLPSNLLLLRLLMPLSPRGEVGEGTCPFGSTRPDQINEFFSFQGPFAFYKGFFPNFGRLGSWNVIMFLTLEQVREWIKTSWSEIFRDPQSDLLASEIAEYWIFCSSYILYVSEREKRAERGEVRNGKEKREGNGEGRRLVGGLVNKATEVGQRLPLMDMVDIATVGIHLQDLNWLTQLMLRVFLFRPPNRLVFLDILDFFSHLHCKLVKTWPQVYVLSNPKGFQVQIIISCWINEKSAPSVAEVKCEKGADVAAGQLHVIRHLRQQKQGLVLWIKSPSPHRGYKILSLRPGVKQMSEILYDEGVGGGGGARDGSRKCETALFAVDLDGPVLRLGTKDDAATGTKRGAL